MARTFTGWLVYIQWRTPIRLRRIYHWLRPSKHKWEPYELPECYPCCGREGVNRVCKTCHKHDPEGFNILDYE